MSLTHPNRLVIAILLSTALTQAFALAGPLSPPPGPVASTPALESRIPITQSTCPGDASNVFIIAAPGTYYLTGNMLVGANQDGIRINSSHVKIDLNGYTIAGNAPTAKNGIVTAASTNSHTIVNGSITFFSNSAINFVNSQGARISDINATLCGQVGVCVGAGSIVQRCLVGQASTGYVLFGDAITISDCTALNCSDTGYQIPSGCTASRCTATLCATGFYVFKRATLESCTARQGTTGFASSGNSVLRGCSASGTSGAGFQCNPGDLLVDCSACDNFAAGFIVQGARVQNCVAADNSTIGFLGTDTPSVFVGCLARNNNAGGINAHPGSVIRSCAVNDNNGFGIKVTTNTDVIDNTVKGNNLGISTPGIWCAGSAQSRNQISGNTVTQCDVGIQVDSSRNAIFANKLSGNTTAFSVAVDNRLGTIVTPGLTTTLVTGSSGGVPSGTTDPWANFVY
ncbi:MAG: hypothetical protein IBJ18_05905 [Phycisphaerales bacterium]|nr:hypothetical protein [Phycisphaerales bacterium]